MKKILSFLFLTTLIISSCSKKDALDNNTPATVAPLSAGFTIDNQDQVKEGIPAQFRNTSVSGVSYAWDFGNGDVSIDKVPEYTFPRCGPVTVQLTVTDAAGNHKTASVQLEVLCTGKHASQGH